MSSGLPHDDTPALGGNYGLDGFQFTDEYGEGVAQSGRLPDAHPHSNTPDGTVHAEFSSTPTVDAVPDNDGTDFFSALLFNSSDDEGVSIDAGTEYHDIGDLGGYLDEGNPTKQATSEDFKLSEYGVGKKSATTPGPVDLSWLEGFQDPERLPETPTDKGLLGIWESWGERTDGQATRRLDYRDPDRARLEATANDPAGVGPQRFTDEQLMALVQGAMRRSAAGHDLKAIFQEIDLRLGDDQVSRQKIKPLLVKVAEEHGVLGKVFLRAMAYPGCHNGRWNPEIKKSASSAQYLVKGEKCKSCVHNTNGRCAKIGKKLVNDVPWKSAFNHYARKLQASGIDVPSTGNYQNDLRVAFGAKPLRQPKLSDERPVHVPVERLTARAAQDALSKLQAPGTEVSKPEKNKGMRKQVQAKVQRWHSAGLLTDVEALKLLKAKEKPEMVLRVAAALAQRRASASTQEYEGAIFETHQAAINDDRPVLPQDIERVLKYAAQRMSEGRAGKDLDKVLKEHFPARVIAAAHDQLRMIRKQHEGLSGFAYVHAAAYASGKKDQGCAKGAAKLRTKGPKVVLAMDRCKGCVRNTGGSCTRYAKRLVKKVPVQNPKEFQREVIARVNGGQATQVYDQLGTRTASTGEAVHSRDVNPVEEFNLGGAGGMTIEFGDSGGQPIEDGDVSWDGGIIL